MDANVIELLERATQKLKYMRNCAYTEKIPADSEDLRHVIAEIEDIIRAHGPEINPR